MSMTITEHDEYDDDREVTRIRFEDINITGAFAHASPSTLHFRMENALQRILFSVSYGDLLFPLELDLSNTPFSWKFVTMINVTVTVPPVSAAGIVLTRAKSSDSTNVAAGTGGFYATGGDTAAGIARRSSTPLYHETLAEVSAGETVSVPLYIHHTAAHAMRSANRILAYATQHNYIDGEAQRNFDDTLRNVGEGEGSVLAGVADFFAQSYVHNVQHDKLATEALKVNIQQFKDTIQKSLVAGHGDGRNDICTFIATHIAAVNAAKRKNSPWLRWARKQYRVNYDALQQNTRVVQNASTNSASAEEFDALNDAVIRTAEATEKNKHKTITEDSEPTYRTTFVASPIANPFAKILANGNTFEAFKMAVLHVMLTFVDNDIIRNTLSKSGADGDDLYRVVFFDILPWTLRVLRARVHGMHLFKELAESLQPSVFATIAQHFGVRAGQLVSVLEASQIGAGIDIGDPDSVYTATSRAEPYRGIPNSMYMLLCGFLAVMYRLQKVNDEDETMTHNEMVAKQKKRELERSVMQARESSAALSRNEAVMTTDTPNIPSFYVQPLYTGQSVPMAQFKIDISLAVPNRVIQSMLDKSPEFQRFMRQQQVEEEQLERERAMASRGAAPAAPASMFTVPGNGRDVDGAAAGAAGLSLGNILRQLKVHMGASPTSMPDSITVEVDKTTALLRALSRSSARELFDRAHALRDLPIRETFEQWKNNSNTL